MNAVIFTIKTTELSLTGPMLTNTDYGLNNKTISEKLCYKLTYTANISTPEALLLLLLFSKVEPHSSVLACYPVYVDCLRFFFFIFHYLWACVSVFVLLGYLF